MKKLSQKNLDKFEFSRSYLARGENEKIIEEVLKLKIDEMIHLDKDDWKTKTHPSNIMSYKGIIKSGMKLSIRKLKDDAGWLIIRKK